MTHSFKIIDADAHVIETERTWDYHDESTRSTGRGFTRRQTIRCANIGCWKIRSPDFVS